MHRYLLEDDHGTSHYYLPCHYQQIIRTILPFTRLFAANGQLLAQTYQPLDCDISLNKYPMRSGRRSKQGKVICPGSQHVGRSGAQTHNLPFIRPHVPSTTTDDGSALI